MGLCIRIVAEHAGDVNDVQDTRWKIIFDGILIDNRLKPQLCFGYTMEVDENDNQIKRWPFLLEPSKDKHGAVLNFSPEGMPEEINIFAKDIEVGCLFTRGNKTAGSSFRITKIEPLG